MVVLMRFWYGASGKGTFVLYSDKFGFMLLPCLVINLKSVIKFETHKMSHDTPKHHASFLTEHCTIVFIAGPIFVLLSGHWHIMYMHACTFVRTHMYDPQGKCMLLHKIGIYLPKVVSAVNHEPFNFPYQL